MSNDWCKLLKVFPEEVWLIILDSIQHSADIRHVWNSSIQFQNLLRPRAVQALFAALIEIVFKYSTANFFNDGRYSKQILHLRHVCRLWKHGVDQALQQERNYFNLDVVVEDMNPFEIDNVTNFIKFGSAQSFKKFQRHFDSSHLPGSVNPFLFRGIGLELPQVNRNALLYFRACEKFLQNYGRQVWFTYFWLPFEECLSEVSFYEKLGNILELMPNLKVLHICSDSRKGLTETHLKYLERRVWLPTLKNLKFVALEYIPLPIVNELIKNNQQIRMVESIHDKCDWRENIYLEQLPLLNCFFLYVINMEHYRALCNANVKCQIRKLKLDLSGVRTSFEEIFQQLKKKLSKNLLELSLCLPESKQISCSEYLELPMLKILHLELKTAVLLDFLIPLKYTLEKLSVVCDNQGSTAFEMVKNAECKIRIYQFWKEPQNSNIWTKFPKLKILRTAEWTGNGWHTYIKK